MTWLAVALFVGAICLVIYGVYNSSQFQECVSQAEQQSGGDPPKDYVSAISSGFGLYRDCTGVFVEKHGEAVTATFTVILAVSTILLWLATIKLARTTDHALINLERPYIAIATLTFLRNPQQISTVVNVVNFGRETGNVTEINAQFFDGDRLPRKPPYSKGRIVPKDFLVIPLGAANQYIRPMAALEQFATTNTNARFFFGYIKYDGILGRGHITRFAGSIPPSDAPAGSESQTAGGAAYNGYT